MDTRRLGDSGLRVSPLCLGTLLFGGQTDEEEAARLVDAARAAGVNFIDTADAYGGGESERVTGSLIAQDRDNWVLATKLGNPYGEGPNQRASRAGYARAVMVRALDGLTPRKGGTASSCGGSFLYFAMYCRRRRSSG